MTALGQMFSLARVEARLLPSIEPEAPSLDIEYVDFFQ